MKRFFLCFIMVFASLVLVFSSSIDQKYYPVSSHEWTMVNDICHIAGVPGPSSNGPLTSYQLSLALDRAENELGTSNPIIGYVRTILGKTDSLYEDEIGSVSLKLEVDGEAYMQSNGNGLSSDAFDQDSDWFIRNYRERPAFLSLTLENTIGDFLYSRLVIMGKQKQYSGDDYWNDNTHFGFTGARFSQNFPFDAGLSLGTNGFFVITGRGRVSLGEGFTGNTAIGDNYDYQEFMKLGYYTKNTGVNLTLTNFDSSRDIVKDATVHITSPYSVQNSKFSGYRELRHSAEYEMTLFDKVKFSLAFITLLDTDTAFDFRYLNPMMILHSMYNFHDGNILEANNMIFVDFSWAVAKKLNLYFQVTMDQFQITGEADGYTATYGYTDPNAFSFLMNLSYTDMIKDGIGRVFAEAVYTAPGMYLNQKYYDEYDNVSHYRVDRILNIEILETPQKPKREVKEVETGFNLPQHMAEHIYMFSGASGNVNFRLNKSILNDVIDFFGSEISFFDENPSTVCARVRVNLAAMRKWAIQYALHAKILTPVSLAESVKSDLEKALENYNEV